MKTFDPILNNVEATDLRLGSLRSICYLPDRQTYTISKTRRSEILKTHAFADEARFHSTISPPPAKKIDKEIIFLHSLATEEICFTFLVVENVQLLSDL